MRVIRDHAASLASTATFTGRVWRTDYLEAEPDNISGLRLHYEPGARSYWHVHDREQVIVAVYGTGLVSWVGLDAPISLATGDWWHVLPGVAHWHGAAPDAPFAHLAVTAGGGTQWLHEVSESEYLTPPTPATS